MHEYLHAASESVRRGQRTRDRKFITHLMKVTGNDVGTVMKYSGHKTLESFSRYIHSTDEGRIVSMQALDNIDGILTAQGSVGSVRSVESVEKRLRKPLQDKQVAR